MARLRAEAPTVEFCILAACRVSDRSAPGGERVAGALVEAGASSGGLSRLASLWPWLGGR